MCVTHSRWRNGPSGSRSTRTRPVPLVAREHLLGPVGRRVVGDDHLVDARREVEGEVLLDDVALVAHEQGHDDLHERNLVIRLPTWTSSKLRISERSPP